MRRINVIVALALLATTLTVPGPAAADIELPDREIEIVIERVEALDNFGTDVFPEEPDFYGVVSVAGVELPRSAEIADTNPITPGWTFRTTVDRSIGTVPVKVHVFDSDGGFRAGDDEADLTPSAGRSLDLDVDVDPCAVGGDVTGACAATLTSAGTDDDSAEIRLTVAISERPVSADLSLTVQRVRALDNFGTDVFPEDADFYGAAIIDGVRLPDTPEIGDDNDITPGWVFERLVDVTATAVPITLEILDADGGLRGEDDVADLVTGPGDRFLDVFVDITTCTFTGDVSGACGDPVVSAGDEDDSAEVTFVIDALPPPAAENLRVTCTHTPVWPQPGDTVTITANLLDDALAPLQADVLEIYVDDRVTPVATAPTTQTTSSTFTAAAGTFFYGCGGTRTGLSVFSDYRRVQVGLGSGGAVPIYFTGQSDQRIDLAFAADSISFTGPTDPAFQTMIETWITTQLITRDVFVVNQDLYNLWILPTTGVVGGFDNGKCNNAAPAGFDNAFSFAESVGLLHSQGLRDCASGRLFSSDTIPVITHEAGHTPFGLPDEYCCDGGYWQPETFPTVYTSESACTTDAPNLGRTSSDCRSFVSSRNDNTYWISEPASSDLMVDNQTEQAGDIRRISWVLNDAGRTTEGPGGAGEPATAPIPPLPTPGTVKVYAVSGSVDGGVTDVDVEVITVHPRYPYDGPDEAHIALGTWTGGELGTIEVPTPLDTHLYDEVTGLPEGVVDTTGGRIDVQVPFHPGVQNIELRTESGVLATVPLDEAISDYCDATPLDADCAAGYDLAIDDMTAVAPLAVVGEPFTVDVTTVSSNAGPASPVPAVLRMDASAASDLAVSPASTTMSDSVAQGTPWSTTQAFDAECLDAGDQGATFDGEVSPGSDERLELDPDNDVGSASVTVECVLPVAINVRPGQSHNTVNAGGGLVPVAVLTTAAGEYDLPLAFDAAWIVPSSMIFASREDALAAIGSDPDRTRLRDEKERTDELTRDGDLDLEARFPAAESGLAPGDVEGCVVGTFVRPDSTGGRFIGCDMVKVNP